MLFVRTSKLSTKSAALRACLVENKHSKSKMGSKTVLSPQQQKELSNRIIRLAHIWCPMTLNGPRMFVFTLCKKNNIPHSFMKEKEMAGRAWVDGFCVLIP
jgi:hypothetical protein